MKNIPLRMCSVCRERKPKNQLYRIVKTIDNVVFDQTGKLNGRGAYICGEEACLTNLKKRKILNKTFNCFVSDDQYDKILEDVKFAKSKN